MVEVVKMVVVVLAMVEVLRWWWLWGCELVVVKMVVVGV